MSDQEEETPEVREPACLLCGRPEADSDICGEKIQIHGLWAHEFCLLFASRLPDRPVHRIGLWFIRRSDILDVVSQAEQESCFICGQSGATITCCETDCDLSFHLPCAKQGGCVTQFIRPFRSFCPTHRPEQAVEVTPEPGTECLICMEPVEERKTFNTMVCPACKNAWFHRDCIQGQALHAGFLSLQCPLCRDNNTFVMSLFTMGIRIPFRPPSWEGGNAFAELGERHRHCDARECLFPGGREEAELEGPWELLLCSSCAAEGTHRHCSGLRNSITRWECDGCAGLGTASRDDSELAGPSTARLSGLEPSEISREPETFSPNTGSLVLSGLSPSSPALDTISPSTSNQVPSLGSSAPETSNLHTNPQSTSEQSLESPSQETSSSSPDSQVTSGSSYSSFPDTEDSSGSSSRRPDRRRNHSRRQRRARSPQLRSRSPHDRTHMPEPSPGRRRPRLTQSGESRRRNRSRLQSETPNPSGRSRSRRDRSRVRAPSAGRCSRSQETPRTSRTHSRFRQQRQTPHPSGRSRSRRDRNCVGAPSAGSRTPSQEASGTSRRRNRSRLQRQTPNPSGRSRSPRDRNCAPASSAGRQNPRDRAARTSQRQQHSRQQRWTSNSSRGSRSRRDRSRVRAPSAGSPSHRSDGETGTHH